MADKRGPRYGRSVGSWDMGGEVRINASDSSSSGGSALGEEKSRERKEGRSSRRSVTGCFKLAGTVIGGGPTSRGLSNRRWTGRPPDIEVLRLDR